MTIGICFLNVLTFSLASSVVFSFLPDLVKWFGATEVTTGGSFFKFQILCLWILIGFSIGYWSGLQVFRLLFGLCGPWASRSKIPQVQITTVTQN